MASKTERVYKAVKRGNYSKAIKIGGDWHDVDFQQLFERASNERNKKIKIRVADFFVARKEYARAYALIENMESTDATPLLFTMRFRVTDVNLRYAISQKLVNLPKKAIPKHLRQQMGYVLVYQELNRQGYGAAIDLLSAMIEKDPRDAKAYQLRSALYRGLNEHGLADADDAEFERIGGKKQRSKKAFKKRYSPAHFWVRLAFVTALLIPVFGIGLAIVVPVGLYRATMTTLGLSTSKRKNPIEIVQSLLAFPASFIISTFYWVPSQLIYQRRFIKRQWDNWQYGIDAIDVEGRPIRQWRFGMNMSEDNKAGLNGAIELWNTVTGFI